MLKLARIAVIGCATLMMPSMALAENFKVEINQTKPLRLSGEVASVVIGNPAIADVTLQGTSKDNLLFVTGRDFGVTNLMILDAAGRQLYAGDVVVTEDESITVSVNRAGTTAKYDCIPRCRPAAAATRN